MNRDALLISLDSEVVALAEGRTNFIEFSSKMHALVNLFCNELLHDLREMDAMLAKARSDTVTGVMKAFAEKK